MCCFSQPVRHVSKTRIYARPSADVAGGQLLVYAMSYASDVDLAMVLPVPTPPGAAEDAVRFVDLSACPRFFHELDALFPIEVSRGGFAPQSLAIPRPATLVVHDVGDFEASFVPSRADFERLDARFRLPSGVWDAPQLAGYADWGFCVFKLRGAAGSGDAEPAAPRGLLDRVRGLFGGPSTPATPPRDVHPMAFVFPRRDPARLFFPTVHVHDGEVHAKAHFDHALYCQLEADQASSDDAKDERWDRSPRTAGEGTALAKPWLDEARRVFRRRLSGDLPNRDVYAFPASP